MVGKNTFCEKLEVLVHWKKLVSYNFQPFLILINFLIVPVLVLGMGYSFGRKPIQTLPFLMPKLGEVIVADWIVMASPCTMKKFFGKLGFAKENEKISKNKMDLYIGLIYQKFIFFVCHHMF